MAQPLLGMFHDLEPIINRQTQNNYNKTLNFIELQRSKTVRANYVNYVRINYVNYVNYTS